MRWSTNLLQLLIIAEIKTSLRYILIFSILEAIYSYSEVPKVPKYKKKMIAVLASNLKEIRIVGEADVEFTQSLQTDNFVLFLLF